MAVYLSVLLDFIFGDPKGFPHPIIAVGKLISCYEKLFYRSTHKKLMGFLFMLAVLVTVGGGLWLVLALLSRWSVLYWIVSIYLMYTALAWRSLKKETGYVITALRKKDLKKARKMVSYVVGRDTENLSEEEVIKADIETLGENTIDGVIAPLFYMILGFFFGMPVVFVYVYKAINTLDSMVGYKNERYKDFGCFSARLDDIVNFIPARFGSLLMLLAGFCLRLNTKGGWKIYKRDRYAHNSPNSAQSESVLAGLLDVQLGGTHNYFGKEVYKPTIGDDIRSITCDDFEKCCRVLDLSVIFTLLLFTVIYIPILL